MSGDDAVALERVPVAGAAQPGLRLVEDQQHAALVALVPQRGEVAGREVDDAAGAQDRLDQAGGEAADRLGVDQVEAEVELAAPVQVPVGVDDGGPEPVGDGQGEVARGGGPVARAPGAVGGAGGGLGHAVPGPGERDDLVPAGDELGHPQRGLVRLGPGRQEHGLLQRRGQRLDEPPGEVEDRAAQHPAVEVVESADLLAHGRDDVRVRVAEDRAHLARGEVEQLAPVLGEHPAALGPVDDPGAEGRVTRVVDQMPLSGRRVVQHGVDATNHPQYVSSTQFRRFCAAGPHRTA